ncbi:hypothetical protein ABVB70_18920 [Agrobacterium radiobacter]|uniref:DNA-directed DNA polymerase n=1 Tax=Agrobacterium radiobacter TaxID=362 RepID=A0ABD5LKN0_AGRRD
MFDLGAARAELVPLAEKVWTNCEVREISGRTVTLKVKFADFQQITRSRSLPHLVMDADEMIAVSQSMLADLFPIEKGIRLLGVTLSSFGARDSVVIPDQLALF